MIRTILIAALVLISYGPAVAGSISTAPFPGARIASGEASCWVSNDGTRPIDVTIEMLNASGLPETPGSTQTFTVAPGATVNSAPPLQMVERSPVRCRFTTSSTRSLRGSFVWVKTNADAPVVIPAN